MLKLFHYFVIADTLYDWPLRSWQRIHGLLYVCQWIRLWWATGRRLQNAKFIESNYVNIPVPLEILKYITSAMRGTYHPLFLRKDGLLTILWLFLATFWRKWFIPVFKLSFKLQQQWRLLMANHCGWWDGKYSNVQYSKYLQCKMIIFYI